MSLEKDFDMPPSDVDLLFDLVKFAARTREASEMVQVCKCREGYHFSLAYSNKCVFRGILTSF